MTGKPCVLAIWAGRREADHARGCRRFPGLEGIWPRAHRRNRRGRALKLDLPPRDLERYLRDNIDFSLDADNLDGLELYFDLCAAAGLIPRARPIEFAESAAQQRR